MYCHILCVCAIPTLESTNSMISRPVHVQARFLTAPAGLLTRFLTAQAGLLARFLTLRTPDRF